MSLLLLKQMAEETNSPSEVKQINRLNIGPSTYLIRTQAGFKRICTMLKSEDRGTIEGYPKFYPCVVVFKNGYRGYHYVSVRTYKVEDYRELLRKQLALLEGQ